jgi:hypothetical protein
MRTAMKVEGTVPGPGMRSRAGDLPRQLAGVLTMALVANAEQPETLHARTW